MDTSRLIINTIDNSGYSVESSTAIAGYTVVKAPKGWRKPKKFLAGASAALKDVLGVSSKDYPELFEVETFNKAYDIYVSAPYSRAEVPVAYLTKDGVFAGTENIKYTDDFEKFVSSEEESIAEIDNTLNGGVTVLVDTGYAQCLGGTNKSSSKVRNITYDSTNSGFRVLTGLTDLTIFDEGSDESKTMPVNGYPLVFKINNESYTLGLKTDGVYIADEDNVAIKVGSVGYIKEGAFTSASISEGKITVGDVDQEIVFIITGEDNTALTKSKVSSYKAETSSISVYWEKSYSASDIKAVLFPKYPSERTLHISFDAFNSNKGYDSTKASSRNLLKMTVYEDGAFHNVSHPVSIVGTLDETDTVNYGFNNSNDSYSSQELLGVYHVGTFDSRETFSEISGFAPVTLSGGVRITEDDTCDSVTLHNYGWQYAIDEEFPEVALFFSSEQNMEGQGDKSTFFQVGHNGPQIAQYSGFIFNETPTTTAVKEIKSSLDYGRMYWNICNIAVIDISRGTRIFSPLTGARALMQARIIDNRWGGAAPMWENANGLGGQLTMVSPYRMKYKYTKEQLSILDSYNYNPVIMDRQYGTMVVGQRTCVAGALTDWSYIGHACAFMTCIKEIRNNVMIPQLGKANNPYYRTLRKEQVEQILAPRLEGNNRIWASAIVDTSTADGVNDVYARKALKFVIAVHVQVDIYSEYVELNFYNEDQSSTVSTT